MHPRDADRFWQLLAGWWGHAAPFKFTPNYWPTSGIARYLCGTQPILSLTALGPDLERNICPPVQRTGLGLPEIGAIALCKQGEQGPQHGIAVEVTGVVCAR